MIIQPRKLCVSSIFIMIYVCALTYIRWSYIHTSISEKMYIGSQYVIILICLLYFALSFRYITVRLFPVLLGSMLFYELIVSAVRGLFITPNIFMDVLQWPLVLLVFYHYCKKEQLPSFFKGISIVGLVLVCILSIPNIFMRELSGTGIFGTYYCMSMLAILYLLVDEKKLCGIFGAAVSVFMLFTIKRAALIVVVLGIGLYYLLKIQQESHDLKRIRRLSGFILGSMAAFVVGVYMLNKFNLSIINRLLLMYDDGGSGRTRIWELILELFNASNRSERVFGHGFHAVFYRVRPFGISRYAHNSYIETLYDYGIVGVSLLLLFVLLLVLNYIKHVRNKDSVTPALGFSLVVMLGLSLVSYFFEQSVMITPLCVVWGVCLNNENVWQGAYSES